MKAARESFAPEGLGACLRRLRELPCGAVTLEEFSQGHLLARCEALQPQVAEGQPCGNTLDCAGGWCDTGAGCPGVCRRYVPGGGACDGTSRCQPGAVCAFGTCRADALLGEACSWPVRCAPEAQAACVDNQCVARKASGPCKGVEECEPGHACVRLVTDGGADAPRECRPARGLDEPCTPGALECGGLLYCEAASARCRPWRELGQTCLDPDGTSEQALCLGSRCGFGAFFQLVCQPYVAPGAACTLDAECGPAGACREGVCITTWCR